MSDEYDDLNLWNGELEDTDPPLTPVAQHIALGMVDKQLSDRRAYKKRQPAEVFMHVLLGKAESTIRRMSAHCLRDAAQKHRKATRGAFLEARNRFAKRIRPLTEKLGLPPTAQLVLFFSYVVRSERILQKVAAVTSIKHRSDASDVLREVFGGDWKVWWDALSGKSILLDSGLVDRPELSCATDMHEVARAFTDLSEAIESGAPISSCLLERAVRVLDGPVLDLEQFRHLNTDLEIVRGLVDVPQGNAQILLAGPPGVGKTQFVRALAAKLNRTVQEIKSEDDNGEPCGRSGRFQLYVLAQKLLTQPERNLLLFDEAEDVFTGDHWKHATHNPRYKGWTNHVLETALMPTVWISNSIDRIDPAYLRRFDHVVKMDVPPRSVRRAMLEHSFSPHGISSSFMDRVAESDELYPADIDRTARALSRLTDCTVPKDALAGCILTARPDGVSKSLIRQSRSQTRIPYRVEWINCDADIPSIIEGLRQRGHGTLGFFGPPGTGKTELARHLARSLDRPLLLKRVSDLVDCHLGQTEKNIARAFEQAAEDGAVLFLDEADSFLQDRARASQSWQITQVNELLAQIDGYNGIAILASNFVDNLDAALMRRIDVKAKFGYLKAAAAQAMFREVLSSSGKSNEADCRPAVAPNLDVAFGDFAAALRRIELGGKPPDAETLSKALCMEVSHRPRGTRPIGFGAGL